MIRGGPTDEPFGDNNPGGGQDQGGGPTDEPPENVRPQSTIDFDLILPSLEAGPNRGRPEYDPHYGYEPYWTGGGWVFDKDPHSKNATLYMCGVRCPKVYTEYGTICARNKHYEYDTFLNFCQLRNRDCSNLERWMVLYKGPCFRNLITYDYHYIQNKTRNFIKDFMKQYTNHEKFVGFCDPCPKRAEQDMPTVPSKATKPPKTTKGLYDLLKHKKSKSLVFEYYPNYGFEPYWADGEWILSTTPQPNASLFETTTRGPQVCGEECHYLFQRIKHVCARITDDIRQDPNGCGTIVVEFIADMICTGNPGDNFDHGYTTFDTYCQFLDAQCRTKFYEPQRWVLMHVGKCKPLETYFKPIWTGLQPVSRMEYYLSSLGTLPGPESK